MGVDRIRQVWSPTPAPPILGSAATAAQVRRWWRGSGRERLALQMWLALALLGTAVVFRWLPWPSATGLRQAVRWTLTADYGLRAAGADMWILWRQRGPEWVERQRAWRTRAWNGYLGRSAAPTAAPPAGPAPTQSAGTGDAGGRSSSPNGRPEQITAQTVNPAADRPTYVILERPDAQGQGSPGSPGAADVTGPVTPAPVVAPTAGSNSGLGEKLFGDTIIAPFGWRQADNGGFRLHEGVDIAQAAGSPVYGRRAGVVAVVVRDAALGLLVQVDSAGGLSVRYGPFRSVKVQPGDAVAVGQVLGDLGAPPPGELAAPHLHLETLVRGEPVNPVPILQRDQP